MIKHFTIPIFIPELACPFQCVFCDQRKISGSIEIPSIEGVDEIIQKYLSTLPEEKARIEIGFFGGNFTGIPESDQRAFLSIAQKYVDNGSVQSIRLSTRPDYISQENLSLLKDFSVKTIELGAQSMDDDVLIKSGRGHTAQDIIDSSELIRQAGFDLGLQIMIGLPGDTMEKCLKTANQIVALKPKDVRIYPTLVIKGTELAELFKEGLYEPLSIKAAVLWTKDIYRIFENANLDIIRVGLHPSEELTNNNSLITGPYHQSFRELVLSELWRDRFFEQLEFTKSKSLIIYVASKELNHAIGYGSSNVKLLEKKFESVKIKIDLKLINYSFYADCY
ncbi:MAG: radical SAM protein [Bacteroidales bacterium]|jgi:histone acetyltransferase (RNA polymerase elongator complex component)|nr:radical SAM protein [Bacteroidales bacterium]